jgi:hypothetical protein
MQPIRRPSRDLALSVLRRLRGNMKLDKTSLSLHFAWSRELPQDGKKHRPWPFV